jgi:glucose/arabinose dehydrogenase
MQSLLGNGVQKPIVTKFILVIFLVWVALIVVLPLTAQETPADPGADVTYRVSKITPANFPVALAYAPDGRLFYTEKITGNVRLIRVDGSSQIEPVINLPSDSLVERGLLGIAFDPDYAENGFIWVVHTEPGTVTDYPANEVVRFTEHDGVGSDPQVMFSASITTGELKHNGGNLHFDNEGRLYLSLGDFGLASNAQNLDALPGKIHRFEVTPDGLQPAAGNPFPGSSVYAYGLRNTFDFTVDSVTGAVFGSENGFHCDDEINRILPGKNYGWGAAYGEQCFGQGPLDFPDYQPPMISYTPTVAPTGIIVYHGAAFPEWEGNLLFCQWNTGLIQRAVLNDDQTQILSITPLDLQGVTCRIDLTIAPDGTLVFLEPGGIYRITPS